VDSKHIFSTGVLSTREIVHIVLLVHSIATQKGTT